MACKRTWIVGGTNGRMRAASWYVLEINKHCHPGFSLMQKLMLLVPFRPGVLKIIIIALGAWLLMI
jgi:hypothetical protein